MTKGFGSPAQPRYWLQIIYLDGSEKWQRCNLKSPAKQRRKAAQFMQDTRVDVVLLIHGYVEPHTVIPSGALVEEYNRESGVLIT